MSAAVFPHPGFISPEDIPNDFPAELIALVPAHVVHARRVVPLCVERGAVVLLADEATQADRNGLEDELSFALGRPARVMLTSSAAVEIAIARYYGPQSSHPEELTGTDAQAAGRGLPSGAGVDELLAGGVRRRASDIHFEPFEDQFTIRYRIDGVLHDVASIASEAGAALNSRIKVMANLDIAERRVAQDGRIRMAFDGREIDFRVSTLPTQFGESVVLRVLDASAVQLDLKQLGMPSRVLAGIRDVIRRPHGIVVVTGPTGSGKTTTLYSCLRALNTTDVKVLTAEDPVEYELEGIVQVAVNPIAGLTFATALRAFLRQDPDVIMIGEIRDLETAQIAIQAALTGHLVLTTLHTNDAAGAVTRLLDMGVEPFLLASTLEGVLAQRLVRRRCVCRRTEHSFPEASCTACNGTGFHGRMGIYEFLRVDEGMRELLTQRAPVESIRLHALKGGMRPLAADAERAVQDGETTAAEVLKHV